MIPLKNTHTHPPTHTHTHPAGSIFQVLLVVHAGADDVAHEQAALGVRAGGAGPGHGEPEELVDHDLT